MPELSTQHILLIICVGLYTAAAAVWDIRTRRIPNKLTLPMFLLGWVYQGVFAGWSGMADAALAFGVGFGVLFVLWMVGSGGGGDVKLMGALSVWLGFDATLLVLIASTVFVAVGTGGVLLLNLIRRGPWQTKKKFLATGRPTEEKDAPIPTETVEERQGRRLMAYAVPVAVATWLVLVWRLPQM